MFCYCSKFNKDISDWNVSNVTNMSHMFMACSNFNQNISKWDINKVLKFNFMFFCCSKFNHNISSWLGYNYNARTSYMFYKCYWFNQLHNKLKIFISNRRIYDLIYNQYHDFECYKRFPHYYNDIYC